MAESMTVPIPSQTGIIHTHLPCINAVQKIDVTGVIHRGQQLNSGEGARIITVGVHFFNFFIFIAK
jgi:hypothetical protein